MEPENHTLEEWNMFKGEIITLLKGRVETEAQNKWICSRICTFGEHRKPLLEKLLAEMKRELIPLARNFNRFVLTEIQEPF